MAGYEWVRLNGFRTGLFVTLGNINLFTGNLIAGKQVAGKQINSSIREAAGPGLSSSP